MGSLVLLTYCCVTVAAATSPRTSRATSVCTRGTVSYLPESGERYNKHPSPTRDGVSAPSSLWPDASAAKIVASANNASDNRKNTSCLNWFLVNLRMDSSPLVVMPRGFGVQEVRQR